MTKILIIKLSALGDAVMASTMIEALQGKYPDAHITWLCGREILPLVELFKGIDRIVSVNNRNIIGGFLSKVRFVLSVWAKIAFRKYDLILLGHSHRLYKLLTLFTFGEKRNFKPRSGKYHGAEYARMAVGEESFAFPCIDIQQDKRADGMVLLLAGGAKNIMSNDTQRRWPLEHYIALAQRLTDAGYKVGLIGGKGDLWTDEAFQQAGLDYTSFVGKTDIAGLLGLIAAAKLLITHDSGPKHFADLLKTPVLALFGPVAPVERSPYGAEHAIFVDIACSPCYDGRKYADCKRNICLENITPEMVMEKISNRER